MSFLLFTTSCCFKKVEKVVSYINCGAYGEVNEIKNSYINYGAQTAY